MQPSFVSLLVGRNSLRPFLEGAKSLNPIDPIHCISDTVKRVPNQLLLLGRNDAVKGHEFAFEIMRKLQENNSDIVLHCTGVEESPEDLQNVVAHGWLEQETKVELLQQSSLLLLPSKWEGQPMVALEALACGTPVLASDSIHSLPDVVEKCSMDEASLWFEKIFSLLEIDDQITGSDSVVNHSVLAVNTNLQSIYDQL